MPVSLIQLVSEQTMPNVLAALALEPAHITLLYTKRSQPHAGWINDALRRAGLRFEIELRPLSPAPDVQETGALVRAACEEALGSGLSPVVNITGGTKLMSIGAFAATVRPAWPALYVDTENRRFLQVGAATLPEALRDTWAALTRAEQRINVDVLAAAHGCEQVSKGENPEPFVELAEFLRTHLPEERLCNELLGTITTRGNPSALLKTIDTPLPSGLPDKVLSLAAASGLVEQRSTGWHLQCPTREVLEQAKAKYMDKAELFAAARPLQFAQAFLCGGWWEVCVWDAARKSGAFRDLRWSVRFGSDSDHLEEDIVAVSGLSLAVFSCKRGGQKDRLNRAFEEFVAAAARLGGAFAEKYFCVAMPINEEHFSTVRSEAARLHARIVGPSARLSPSSLTSIRGT